jgi:hypothetical protein
MGIFISNSSNFEAKIRHPLIIRSYDYGEISLHSEKTLSISFTPKCAITGD